MLKFEAKREILQKFGKNWGATAPQPPGSAAHVSTIDFPLSLEIKSLDILP